MRGKGIVLCVIASSLLCNSHLRACYLHDINSFSLNLNASFGHSTNTTINNAVSTISADVQSLQFTLTDTYIRSTGIPSHDVGPFPSNPNVPSNRNYLFRLPETPTVQSGTKTATSLGPIGFMVNGVPFFNASDGHSYNNLGIWTQNANVVEAPSFDAGMGHPQQQGAYHYHQQPALLRSQLGDDGAHHSPILGFAFDGFPVYGPYGYANPDGTGGVKRENSSYQLRNISTRTTKPDGTALSANQYGPAVGTTYPLGYYLEDYVYTSGSGDLDQYNGKFTITPDYPDGTYAYFTTLDSLGKAAYPYIVGPTYNGVLQNDNRTQTVSVPGSATTFAPSLNANWASASDGTWCNGSNWQGGAEPAGAGTSATFAAVGTGPVTVCPDEPKRVGTINFNSTTPYTIGGTWTMTMLAVNGAGINVAAGNQVIALPLVLATNATMNVASGASLDIQKLQPTAATINKTGAGRLQVGSLSAGSLNISSGRVAFATGMSGAARVRALSITSGAALDLADDDLVIDYDSTSPLAAIATWIQSGYANGAWTGTGIVSSSAASNPATALGYIENSSAGLAIFSGQPVDSTSILIRYTLFGDANIDGTVDTVDFNTLAARFGQSGTWSQGDFDYSGTVDTIDFNLLAGNFARTMPAEAGTPKETLAPEPGLAALALGLYGLGKGRARLKKI